MAMRLAAGRTALTERETMQKIIILSAAALLAGVTFANAKHSNDLINPSYYAGVTGDEERDTFAFNTNAPSHLQTRFSARCSVEASCADITTGSVSQDANVALKATYRGNVESNEERDTFAY